MKIIEVNRSKVIKQVKKKFVTSFNIVYIDLISFYFGLKIEINYIKKILKLFQPAYINKILVKYHFNQAKPCNIPIKEKILLFNEKLEASQAKQK